MLAKMDEATFQKWMAYWRAEPFGAIISNKMLARVAASNAMCPGDEDDFLPRVV